ncbi:transferase family protein [Penicillium macrosclerotiorum]|uniref:transferase family protein n=1 Tax=Penicillium macrosclerotiorum TaxID=303699 RepID=UPI0025467CD1|nr:transferase family protein [Penicillium macrosclerotiorum]KAJ5666879.1 transferase family protein [Penicillium macrosclerotiorum]
MRSERLFPSTAFSEHATPLSLLDATTADFAATSVVWLFERPTELELPFYLFEHFRQSVRIALDAYPQFSGQLKSIETLDPTKLRKEEQEFPPHARRFGRVYSHCGTSEDPGVEFITATIDATLESLSPASRTINQPLFDRKRVSLNALVPSTRLANCLQLSTSYEAGRLLPVMAIQVTVLGCGGFALAVKVSHPLADIHALIAFVKDWARISRWMLSGQDGPRPLLDPIFDPSQLDGMAIGDINASRPDPQVLTQSATFPLHRYDWWAAPAQCPWVHEIPEPFRDQNLAPVGKEMPWSDWDFDAPMSHYLVHLNRQQVDWIWNNTIKGLDQSQTDNRISRHDAVLAHLWSCITRARNQQDDAGLVHCNLAFGTRSALGLQDSFIGSPVMMLNIEMTGTELASSRIPRQVQQLSIAQRIRQTISQMNNSTALGSHIHSQRHLIVTSWARAGLYEIDFGSSVSPCIRYAEGVIPNLDGDVVIKDAPPSQGCEGSGDNKGNIGTAWTDHGVDITLHLRSEDMERLIRDPRLLPQAI